ncbi:MAG: calcium-binding protein [Bauldia sp.]|nr:calcium-binding protein [Bauldia sp.]
MVKFNADVAVNNQKLSELSLLSSFTDMKLINRTHKTVTAIDQDAGVTFRMEGSGLVYKGSIPKVGIIKSIEVVVDGDVHYELTNLLISVSNMDHYFSKSFPALSKQIFSGNDTIKGSEEGDVLYGYKGQDKINGNDGDDGINGGKGADTVKGGVGNDSILGAGGSDNLKGNNGDDTIGGGGGSDTINGGVGNDILTGNKGFNTFVFNSALDEATNVDTITDFKSGGDAIDLALKIFSGLSRKGVLKAKEFAIGTHATDADQRIIYDDTTGATYYDADGNGGGAQVQFATLSTHLAMSNTDFFVI